MGEDDGHDHGDEEADHHEGDEGDDQGPWQDGCEGERQEDGRGHEEEGRGHFRSEEAQRRVGESLCVKTAPRTEVTKKIWAYIKKNSLNEGRTIKPDATLKAVFPVASLDMLKMAGYVSKHLS